MKTIYHDFKPSSSSDAQLCWWNEWWSETCKACGEADRHISSTPCDLCPPGGVICIIFMTIIMLIIISIIIFFIVISISIIIKSNRIFTLQWTTATLDSCSSSHLEQCQYSLVCFYDLTFVIIIIMMWNVQQIFKGGQSENMHSLDFIIFMHRDNPWAEPQRQLV